MTKKHGKIIKMSNVCIYASCHVAVVMLKGFHKSTLVARGANA